jgi:hypothetical protein
LNLKIENTERFRPVSSRPEKFILSSVHIECVEDTAECAGAQSKLVDPHAPSLPIRSFRLLASPFRAGVFPRIRFQACRRSHSSR